MTILHEKLPVAAAIGGNMPVPNTQYLNPHTLTAVYAAPGVGNCMVPLIPADAMLAFDPIADVEPGDIVVLWFAPDAARRMGQPGWVKRLVAPLPPAGFVGLIEVEMLNPQRTFTLRSTDVRAIHKCVGLAQSKGQGVASYKPSPPGSWGSAIPPSAAKPSGAIVVQDAPPEPIKLELFSEVPGAWAIVHAAEDNRNAPIICKGEIVIVESNGKPGWLPTEGGLFLIEHVSRPFGGEQYERRTRSIVQTHRNGRGNWYASGIRRGFGPDGVFYCSDGPYSDECHLADKLVGKVVGLLACSLKQGRA